MDEKKVKGKSLKEFLGLGKATRKKNRESRNTDYFTTSFSQL